jgi:hypothetical protein
MSRARRRDQVAERLFVLPCIAPADVHVEQIRVEEQDRGTQATRPGAGCPTTPPGLRQPVRHCCCFTWNASSRGASGGHPKAALRTVYSPTDVHVEHVETGQDQGAEGYSSRIRTSGPVDPRYLCSPRWCFHTEHQEPRTRQSRTAGASSRIRTNPGQRRLISTRLLWVASKSSESRRESTTPASASPSRWMASMVSKV